MIQTWKLPARAFAFFCLAVGILPLLTVDSGAADQVTARRFTVADDIELTRISQTVMFSPDDGYFVVASDRGRLDLNRPESSLRVYSTEDIRHVLSGPSAQEEPAPVWTITQSTYKYGPIISNVRWLADSTGLVFLSKTASGTDQLFLAKIPTKALQALTPDDQNVVAFDVYGESRFVYCIQSPTIRLKADEAEDATAIAGTGRGLMSLLGPEESVGLTDLSELWAVLGGKRFRVFDAASGQALAIHEDGLQALALSPDGHYVVTAVTVNTVPLEWETRYPPPVPSSPYRVRAGRQDPYAPNGQGDVSQYVLVDLISAKIRTLVPAPTGSTAGWAGSTFATWASDGQSVVMSNTFLPRGAEDMPAQDSRPCVAVADLRTGLLTCVERRRAQSEQNDEENWRVVEAHFSLGSDRKLTVSYQSGGSTTYTRSADGSWTADATTNESAPRKHPVDVSFKQGLNDPPVLLATDTQSSKSRTIWNPNPQLRNVRLGEVSTFKWKDKTGRDWVGGLYKPPDYVRGKRYPLVIQTHGFEEQEFRPSGAFPTAFAAQELAAVGFLVLQLEDCNVSGEEEGPCQVAGYEAGVRQLAADGLVDRDHVGIIGFSRTCYYVLQALTTGTLYFKAASITDGFDEGYLQYMMEVDDVGNAVAHEADAMIGAPPFGAGLLRWLSRSPEFNMNKVETPLQVVALGHRSLLSMWEPYAALRYLKRPVDLIVLHSNEHLLTNPASRMVSQGSTVDWFLFWLKGEEVPDPSKAEQYDRWRKLRVN